MDKWEEKYHVNRFPLDLLMNPEKLREFEKMFAAHTIRLNDEVQDAENKLERKKEELDYVMEKQKDLQEYIKFLEFGGHNLAKQIIEENHHVIIAGESVKFKYKVCGKNVLIKRVGYQTCIRKEKHKGKCSNLRSDRGID